MSLCMKRRSIRKFTDQIIDDTIIEALLTSAMQAPSARNQQPWEFMVIKNKAILTSLSEVSGGAKHLEGASIGILTLMKEDVPAPKMAPQDLSSATMNILLEATHQGLGAVWIGVYPITERLDNIRNIFDIPEGLVPFSLIALGYPDEPTDLREIRYDSSRVKVID